MLARIYQLVSARQQIWQTLSAKGRRGIVAQKFSVGIGCHRQTGMYLYAFGSESFPVRVNSSLLFLEIAGIAIATWFVSRASRNLAPRILRLITYIVAVSAVVGLCAFGWFVWPRWYTEYDGVRTQRLTGTRYRWSDLSRSWLTESELETQLRAAAEANRVKAKPVLDELRLIRFGGERNDMDQVGSTRIKLLRQTTRRFNATRCSHSNRNDSRASSTALDRFERMDASESILSGAFGLDAAATKKRRSESESKRSASHRGITTIRLTPNIATRKLVIPIRKLQVPRSRAPTISLTALLGYR